MSEATTNPTIRRLRRRTDFTIIANHGLRNPHLSWKAKGLLAYLLSLPDDWEIRRRELSRHATDGRDGTNTGFEELIKAGYIINEGQQRTEDGRFHAGGYVVSDHPFAEWMGPGKTTDELPDPDPFPAPPSEISAENLAGKLGRDRPRPAPLEEEVPDPLIQHLDPLIQHLDPLIQPCTENPSTANPATGKPATENPSLLNTIVPKTDLQKTDLQNPVKHRIENSEIEIDKKIDPSPKQEAGATVTADVGADAVASPSPSSAAPPPPPDDDDVLNELVPGSRARLPYASAEQRRFDEFRVAYPGKTDGLPTAWPLFVKACKARKLQVYQEVELLLEAVAEQEGWHRQARLTGNFLGSWRNMSTWLGAAGWLDEPPQWAAGGAAGAAAAAATAGGDSSSATKAQYAHQLSEEELDAYRKARARAEAAGLRKQGEIRRRVEQNSGTGR